MFKRKKIIFTCMALFINFVILGFGVYAATNPNLSVTGQITYTLTDARVLVQGKVNGYASESGYQNNNQYPTANEIYSNSTRVNEQSRYLDFTTNNAQGTLTQQLSTWTIGSLKFYDDFTGLKDIVISFKLTNHSAYAVKATVSFGATLDENLTRTASKTEILLLKNGGDDEVMIRYSVKNPVTIINSADVAMNIEFEKYDMTPTTSGWTTSASGNDLTIKKYTGSQKNVVVPSELNGKSIIGIESKAFQNNTTLQICIIPENIKTIGEYAFWGCTNLTAIVLPDGLETIGQYAFSGCTSLTTITLPDSLRTIQGSAFKGCTSLIAIDLPDSLQTIKRYAFSDCTSLIAIDLPARLVMLEAPIFSRCTSLTSISVDKSNTVYSDKDSNVVYEIVTNTVVAGCKNSVIPNTTKIIGGSAFSGCTGLTTIELPASVTTIGSSAFFSCTNLTTIDLPNGLQTIGGSAFYGCTNLTTIDLPASVTTIGSSAFYGCTSLTTITLPDTLQTIGSSAFYGCTGLTTIDLPDSLQTLGSNAFYGCTNLITITLPASVTTIENYTFQSCTRLQTIVLPDTLQTIGSSAFSGCTNLITITLPASVTTIENYTFQSCTGLTTMILQSQSVVSLGHINAFSEADNVKFYVPASLVDSYKTASKWSSYADRIFSIESLA